MTEYGKGEMPDSERFRDVVTGAKVMALRALYFNSEEIPEDVRKRYVEQDGKYILDVEPVGDFKLSDGSALKSALQTERQKRSELEKSLERFEGLDPSEARTAVEKLSEMGSDPKLKVQELVDAQVETISKKHAEELNGLKGRNEQLTGQLKTMILDNKLLQKITELNGKPSMLMPAVRENILWSEENGEVKPLVRDPEKPEQPRYVVNDTGSAVPMGPEHLLEEWAKSEDWAPAFKSSGASGSGATGGQSVRTSQAGQRVLPKNDLDAHGDNLEGIARGEVVVE